MCNKKQGYIKIMSVRIATIIGATGLIGNHLLQMLQKDDYFTTVRVLVRRPFSHTNYKTEVKLVDFTDHESFKLGIDGSHTVFCSIGTTQQKVKGDKTAYRKIDYDIAVNAAKFCKETGCHNFLLVSSVGANSDSNNFYLKLKGEIENAVKAINLRCISVFRPSMFLGIRKEKRTVEQIGQAAMQAFSFVLLGKLNKYKPIHAQEVAAAMLQISKKEMPGFSLYQYQDMKKVNGEL
jgi:uncharacterized protein YbjT (DUF2867 family)